MLKQTFLEGKAYYREYKQYHKFLLEGCKHIFKFVISLVVFQALYIFKVSTLYINAFYIWYTFIMSISGIDVEIYLKMMNSKQARYLNCYPIGFIKGISLKLLKCSFYYLTKNTQSNFLCCIAYFIVYKSMEIVKIFTISELVIIVCLEIILLSSIWKKCNNLTFYNYFFRQIIGYIILAFLFDQNLNQNKIKIVLGIIIKQNILSLKYFVILTVLFVFSFIGIYIVLKSFEQNIYKKNNIIKKNIYFKFGRINSFNKELLYNLREKRSIENLKIIYLSGLLCFVFLIYILKLDKNKIIILIAIMSWMEQSVSILINSFCLDREKIFILQYLLTGSKISNLLMAKVKTYIILLIPFTLIYLIIISIGTNFSILTEINIVLYFCLIILMNIYYLAKNSSFKYLEDRSINMRMKGYQLVHSVIYMLNIMVLLSLSQYVFVICGINGILIVTYTWLLRQERKAYFGEYKEAF